MRVVALVSGGKDSTYNMMQCVAEGHEIVALANLHPEDKDELDSYMYQTVGHQGIEMLAAAMELPLFRKVTHGQSTQRDNHYTPTEADEVEDLLELLESVKGQVKAEAVAVGAILSDYQRIRVENVCKRLNLVSLAYLWRRNQSELLQEMIDCGVNAILIKVAALGLQAEHLGNNLEQMQPHLLKMSEKYGLNVCGEGGEYETFTLDCPLFKQRIVVDDVQIVICSKDSVCPVGYVNFNKLHLEPKGHLSPKNNRISDVKTSSDYLIDLNHSDLSDHELENGEEIFDSNPEPDPPSPIEASPLPSVNRESVPLTNRSNSAINRQGWMWMAGVQGEGDTSEEAMMVAMDNLQEMLQANGYSTSDLNYVTMYIKNMGEYGRMNEIYHRFIRHDGPPTRVCVELPMPDNCHVILEAVAFKSIYAKDLQHARHTMHVQGISHWAPANIGPYSQSTRIDNITYVSGQIALVPGKMTIIEGGIRPECKLALRHVSRLTKAMNCKGQLRDVVQGICFLTHPSYITEARRIWEAKTTNAIMDFICVPALPRNALVEWQVWAHDHNDKFDYEETGCSIDDFTISIRRRWNYENNCAAIVCYVSTGLATSTTKLTELNDEFFLRQKTLTKNITPTQLQKILRYITSRFLKDFPSKGGKTMTTATSATTPVDEHMPQLPTMHLKIFYQVTALSPDILISTVRDFQTAEAVNLNMAFSVLPANYLQNYSTFLSICGIRHEQ